MTRRKLSAAELARQLAEILGQQPGAANEEEPVLDEEAIRERAHRAAERMRRERHQG